MNELSYPTSPPQVMTWFKAYCICMAIMYLIAAGLGVFLMSGGADLLEDRHDDNELSPEAEGAVLAVMGTVLFALFVPALFFRRKPWAWIYGIVLICIGMTSACCLPVTIPLLIYWIKPEAKRYFGQAE